MSIFTIKIDETALRKLIREEVESIVSDYIPLLEPSQHADQSQFITIQQASKLLGVSESTIRRYKKKHKLKSYRLDRRVVIDRQELIDSIRVDLKNH